MQECLLAVGGACCVAAFHPDVDVKDDLSDDGQEKEDNRANHQSSLFGVHCCSNYCYYLRTIVQSFTHEVTEGMLKLYYLNFRTKLQMRINIVWLTIEIILPQLYHVLFILSCLIYPVFSIRRKSLFI